MSDYEKSFRLYWAKRIAFCLVFAGIIAAVWGFGLHAYFSSRISPAASLTIAYVIALIPVFTKKLWRIFTDRSYTATVSDVKYSEGQTFSKEDMRTSATIPLYRITMKLVYPNGSAAKKNIESLEPFYQDMWYRTGDRIVYHRGTKYPLIVGGRRFCAYCDDGLRDGENLCRRCGKANFMPTDMKTDSGRPEPGNGNK